VTRGAENVARRALGFSRLGLEVRLALVNGVLGGVSLRDGEPFAVIGLTVRNGRIATMDVLADPERLSQLDLTVLDQRS
jgi:RNA polymerase sigma-70 factor (ECF subfamily)